MTVDLKNALDIIIKIADPDKVILFGSRARGEDNPESDYDLLILKKNIQKRRKLAQKLYVNFIGINASIDILVNELSEYEKLKSLPYLIYRTIDREGIILYDKK